MLKVQESVSCFTYETLRKVMGNLALSVSEAVGYEIFVRWLTGQTCPGGKDDVRTAQAEADTRECIKNGNKRRPDNEKIEEN